MNYVMCKSGIFVFILNNSYQSFRLMYNHLVGGVLALSKEQFIKVNGFSNLYWGWGVSRSFRSLQPNIYFCLFIG